MKSLTFLVRGEGQAEEIDMRFEVTFVPWAGKGGVGEMLEGDKHADQRDFWLRNQVSRKAEGVWWLEKRERAK